MLPRIDKSAFGWIKIAGKKYKHDIVIELDSSIRRRNKKLSKAQYGTSHMISLDEAIDIFSPGLESLLIGSGMFDSVRLSDQATTYYLEMGVNIVILPTQKAISYWNDNDQNMIGVFHVTC